MKYNKLQTTYTSRAGANTRLSLIGGVEIVQDSICEFFKSIDIDEITLKTKYNCIWVFTRNSVEFLLSLNWDESFNVECYISSISPAKIVVNTAFYNIDGKLAVKAETDICLVDLSTFRLKRIDDTFVSSSLKEAKTFEMTFNRPQVDVDAQRVASVVVPSTSIDYCGHVNNVEYLRFILNTYPAKYLKKSVTRLDIIYLSQALEGDMLDIYKSSKEIDIFEIKSGDKSIVRCGLEFE